MSLKGKYGLSKLLLTYQNAIITFYMLDIPFFFVVKYFSLPLPVDGVFKYQLLVKGIIILWMGMESLCNHVFGPGRIFKNKGTYIAGRGHCGNHVHGPSCNHGPAVGNEVVTPKVESETDGAMGLINKSKES